MARYVKLEHFVQGDTSFKQRGYVLVNPDHVAFIAPAKIGFTPCTMIVLAVGQGPGFHIDATPHEVESYLNGDAVMPPTRIEPSNTTKIIMPAEVKQ